MPKTENMPQRHSRVGSEGAKCQNVTAGLDWSSEGGGGRSSSGTHSAPGKGATPLGKLWVSAVRMGCRVRSLLVRADGLPGAEGRATRQGGPLMAEELSWKAMMLLFLVLCIIVVVVVVVLTRDKKNMARKKKRSHERVS